MPNGEREMRCTVRRAEPAEVQAVLAFAAQFFADEQQIAGEPFAFYRGRVTPILLKRTDFVCNTRK
jgi:hypothetical protein